jgi:hypothetical protein
VTRRLHTKRAMVSWNPRVPAPADYLRCCCFSGWTNKPPCLIPGEPRKSALRRAVRSLKKSSGCVI